MARFVLVSKDGKVEIEIEGEPGEEITAEQTVAYSQMFAAHSLGQIAERLEDLANRVSDLGDIIEQTSGG